MIDLNSIMKMMGGAKENPALNQILGVKAMLDKLPKEEQVRVMTRFVDDLKESVEKLEGKKVEDVKTEE